MVALHVADQHRSFEYGDVDVVDGYLVVLEEAYTPDFYPEAAIE